MIEIEPVERKRNWGCSIVGWLLFVIVLAFIVLVGVKTAEYYGKISRGELVDLPQYRSAFTTAKTQVLSRSQVDRAVVEDGEAPAIGAGKDAAVLTIVEFADFECPYSKDVSSSIRALVTKYGDKVRLIYRDYPIDDIHVHARQAAIAGECAQEQGKFWAYHDRLYQNTPVLGHADLLRYAQETGLDGVQFEKCLSEERYKEKVAADVAAAQTLGVSGTPAFFFNGQKVEGAIPLESLELIIQRMIAAGK